MVFRGVGNYFLLTDQHVSAYEWLFAICFGIFCVFMRLFGKRKTNGYKSGVIFRPQTMFRAAM